MEINITRFYNEATPSCYSASAMELGNDAGKITWENAKDASEEWNFLNTDKKLQAMRDWAKSSGGWDDEEIAAWSDQYLNALFLQLISGDIREKTSLCSNWSDYYKLAKQGTVGSCLFEADGIVYYTLDDF